MNAAAHIRRSGQYRADKRFRLNGIHGGRAIANRAGTLCGAEPTYEDTDKKTAIHIRESVKVAPTQLAHWITDICPACLKRLP